MCGKRHVFPSLGRFRYKLVTLSLVLPPTKPQLQPILSAIFHSGQGRHKTFEPALARPGSVLGRLNEPSTDRNGDESQKFVVRHRLFQHCHHPKAGGLAFDLGIVDAGDQ
jgi:hypothetical protein